QNLAGGNSAVSSGVAQNLAGGNSAVSSGVAPNTGEEASDVSDNDSASRVDIVPALYEEPKVMGSVELAVDDLDDDRLVDAKAGNSEAKEKQIAAQTDAAAQLPNEVKDADAFEVSADSGNNAVNAVESDDEETPAVTSSAQKVTVSGRKILDDVTWLIGPGDRFGIVGANGAGKSTLLKIIDGTLTPTAGHVKIGKTVKFAVLSQRLDELEKLNKYKIKEVLSRYKPTYVVDGKEVSTSQLMERLGFSAAQLMTPIADLSGGQKRRMQLLLILLDEPNVLILDEPGNDLDTDMLAVMEDLLDSWPGTLIVVSHDRYLLERVTDEQFALIGGKVRHLPGGVDDYLNMVQKIENGETLDEIIGDGRGGKSAGKGSSSSGSASGAQSSNANDDGDNGNSDPQSDDQKLTGKAFHDATRRLSAIERKLAKLETEKTKIERTMASHDPADYVGLGKLNEQLSANSDESESLEAEWMELSEQVE
ncbi:ATP-binding cassette domain-containing protein, partial [Bifidobacterium sp. ESL0745]|uniref:ATP-binding cassette domain-containing protein n=1 Tax=Bifidobacterium sp. ESL0745 TaxID=2983226 RepID=UPI0023F6C6EE